MELSIFFKRRIAILLFLIFLIPLSLTGCAKSYSIEDYFSEYRSNLLIAETDSFSMQIYALKKEHPFVADGAVGELTYRTEIYIHAKNNSSACKISFRVGSVEYGGEASFDGVKQEYFYSCAAELSSHYLLPLVVQFGDSVYEITAHSIKTEKTLSGEQAASILQDSEREFFQTISDKNGLNAELHVRLLYEDAPYYYIGVVEKDGKRTAFLLDGETGKVLAKRES